MIFTMVHEGKSCPSSSSSSSSLLFPLARFPRIGSKIVDATKVWEPWMDARIRICVTIVDPIFGKNSIPINIARGRDDNEVEK